MDSTIYAIYLIVYFAFMIGVGVYHALKIRSVDEYLIAGWSVGYWRIVGTIVATWCGAAAFIGFVGMGFTSGMNGFFFWVIPGVLFTIFFVLLFARILRKLQLYTIPDAFALRFGRNAAFIPSLFQIFVYAIPTLAIQFIGMGTIFKTFFGMNMQLGIVLGFALIFVYTFLGGLPSTILTDTIQAVILYLGILLLFFLGLYYAGGLAKVIEVTPGEFLHPFGKAGFLKFLGLALTVGPFYMLWQATWQRIYAAKDGDTAVRGGVTGFILAGLATLFSFAIGVVARGYLPLDTKADLVFTTAISTVFPAIIGGIIVMGLAAALMSGGDSFIMMGSASVARDIYQQYFKPEATKSEMLKISRWSVVLISLLALVVALIGKGIIPVYIMVVKTAGAGLVFPFFAMMFWKRATRKGILAGMVVGAVVTVVWYWIGNPWIMEAILGYLSCLVVMVIVSLLTDHAPDEQVKAAYYEPLDAEAYISRLSHEG